MSARMQASNARINARLPSRRRPTRLLQYSLLSSADTGSGISFLLQP